MIGNRLSHASPWSIFFFNLYENGADNKLTGIFRNLLKIYFTRWFSPDISLADGLEQRRSRKKYFAGKQFINYEILSFTLNNFSYHNLLRRLEYFICIMFERCTVLIYLVISSTNNSMNFLNAWRVKSIAEKYWGRWRVGNNPL